MGKWTGTDVTESWRHWRCNVKDPRESQMADKWVTAHLSGTKIEDKGSKSNQHEGPIQKGQEKNHPSYQRYPWSPVPISTHEVQCQFPKVKIHSLPSCIIAMTIHMDAFGMHMLHLWWNYGPYTMTHVTCMSKWEPSPKKIGGGHQKPSYV